MKTKISPETGNPAIDLALDTIKIKKQALVFVNTKRSAEKTAEDIAKEVKDAAKECDALSEEILNALSRPTKQCERLAKCVKSGIAFHHAGLVAKQRELIENSFRKGTIKIICATPTLAYGVDLPAYRVILKDLKRYGHHGLAWIPVLEYLQMAGRAGRPRFDKEGEAVAVASSENEKDKIYEMYILGEPEEIYSKLAVEPVLRMYLLSLIASGVVGSKEQVLDFFSKTFWAFQFKDMKKIESMITKVILMLKDWGFIEKGADDDFKSALHLDKEYYEATVLGKRVAELYIDPYTANFIIGCMKRNKEVMPIALLQMICHTLEIRPLLKVKVKEYEELQERLAELGSFLLEDEPDMYDESYDDFLNSFKTALFMQEWIDEKDEEYLLEQYSIRPGEIRAKLDIADWLLYTSYELARISKLQKILPEISKIRLRMKYGAKEELLTLLKLKDIGRVRARALYINKIKTTEDVKKADIGLLTHILGKKIAENVKKQVGIEAEEVKEEGQKGLDKYSNKNL